MPIKQLIRSAFSLQDGNSTLPEGVSQSTLLERQLAKFVEREQTSILSSVIGVIILYALLLPISESSIAASTAALLRLFSMWINHSLCKKISLIGEKAAIEQGFLSKLAIGVFAAGVSWGLFVWPLNIDQVESFLGLSILLTLACIAGVMMMTTSLLPLFSLCFLFAFWLFTLAFTVSVDQLLGSYAGWYIFALIVSLYFIILLIFSDTLNKQYTQIIIADLSVKALNDKLIKTNNELQESIQIATRLASHDDLTGMFNRRAFIEQMNIEHARNLREKKSGFLIMMDLDKFKLINDDHGHAVGDSVLVESSKLLKDLLRPTDIVARWGGEEFVIYLSNTSRTDAHNTSERLRKALTTLSNPSWPEGLLVSASFGVAEMYIDSNFHSALKQADDALYRAKDGGRNQVCFT